MWKINPVFLLYLEFTYKSDEVATLRWQLFVGGGI